MQRVAVQNRAWQSRSRRHILIGVLLALCVLSASTVAIWAYAHKSNNPAPVSQANSGIPYKGHRSGEVPLSTSRSLALGNVQVSTTNLPWGIALDPSHGYVWVAEPGCEPLPACTTAFSSTIGQYAYSDGAFIRDYVEPKGYTGPLFVVADPAGDLWFTQPTSDAIGEFDPINNMWHQWSVKKNSNPYDLVLDAQGNLWFTEWGGNQIGFFNTHTHTLVETPIPTAHTDPYGITIDKKGTVWFAENSPIGQIGSFTLTANGRIKIVEYAVNALRPHLITTDALGNVWFTEGFAGYINEFNPKTGADLRFRIFQGVCLNVGNCTGTHISGIRVDNHGNIWFSDSLNQQVGYLVPATGRIVVRTVRPNAHPHDGLILDPNGRVWFTEQDAFTLNVWPMSSVK